MNLWVTFSGCFSSFLSHFLSQAGANGDHAVMSVEEVAMGFLRVANEAMCRPIRALTQVLLSVESSEGYYIELDIKPTILSG